MAEIPKPVGPDELGAALRRAVAALRDAEVPFALFGSTAMWAIGGYVPDAVQDIDFVVREAHLEQAVAALEEIGCELDLPEEHWLVKLWLAGDDGVRLLIDLIHSPAGLAVDDELFARVELRHFLAMEMPVVPVTDILVSKLHAVTEQELDFTSHVQFARALREQIDWPAVTARTAGKPFARGFLTILHDVGVLDTVAPAGSGDDGVLARGEQPAVSSVQKALRERSAP